MAVTSIHPYPNRLAVVRGTLGLATEALATAAHIDPHWYARIETGEVLPTLEEFDALRAALGGVTADALYDFGFINTIGGNRPNDHPDYARFYGQRVDNEHMLVSKGEITWLERDVPPDRSVDVFVNMSCGPQEVPHLLLNTTSVFDALGVSFAAGAGRIVCCGTYYRGNGQTDAAYRMHDASVSRGISWGAATTVHWCTQCVNTFGETALRRELSGSDGPRLKNIQLLDFLEACLLELGDKVPWQKSVPARVAVAGRAVESSPTHEHARKKVADVLRLVPGVEVVGVLDVGDLQRAEVPKTAAEVQAQRAELALRARAMGADTLSGQHHSQQRILSRFASEELAVRHAISIVADALGREHPDRYQAAVRLGDPEAALEQLRPVWESWGMPEAKARTLATELFDPAFAAGPSRCSCGNEGNCGEKLISVDVLNGEIRAVQGESERAVPR